MNHLVVQLTAHANPAIGLLSLTEYCGSMLVICIEETLIEEEIILQPRIVTELAFYLSAHFVESHHSTCLLILWGVTIVGEIHTCCQLFGSEVIDEDIVYQQLVVSFQSLNSKTFVVEVGGLSS